MNTKIILAVVSVLIIGSGAVFFYNSNSSR